MDAVDKDFVPDDDDVRPSQFNQGELNDLVRDLALSKEKAELLASCLKEKGMLKEDIYITYFRKCNLSLIPFFSVDGPLCFCNYIDGLFYSLSEEHNPFEWHLFIDLSKRSLKAVLLHIGNKKPSIPFNHSVHLRESYKDMQVLLNALKYPAHKWQICGDLK